MNMEQLPDDVLVMVMQCVSVVDLFACRLVCKRLCSLTLHPDVWRHRSLRDNDPRAGAVLRLAPCLDTLTVTGRVPTLAATTTRCAVASLILRAHNKEAFNAAEYALAVRNQELLGRLRELVIDLSRVVNPILNLTKADVLFRTVASCSGLKLLNNVTAVGNTLVVHGPPRSSLTNFVCTGGADSASFVNSILDGHADTLEEVDIHTGSSFEDTSTADLMAAMPRLQSLHCDNRFLGLEAVATCKTLRDVSIAMYAHIGEIDRVEEFLSQANQLQRVHLAYCSEDYTVEYLEVLVEALTSSRRSRVERLCLEDFEDVRPLVRALPSFPALRHLDVTSATLDDELLLGITPVTAPALRRLEVLVERETCPHAWIHRGAVRATLIANTSLHIQLCCRAGDECDCETCAEGCHREVNWAEENKIGLFSHDPDKCPSPEDHTDDIAWQRAYTYDRPARVSCTWMHT